MPAFGVPMFYRVTWKNGDVSIVGLRAGQDLVLVLDELGDPSDARVEPYDGPFLVTFSGGDVRLEACEHTRQMLQDLKRG